MGDVEGAGAEEVLLEIEGDGLLGDEAGEEADFAGDGREGRHFSGGEGKSECVAFG